MPSVSMEAVPGLRKKLRMDWQEIGPGTFASHAQHVANLSRPQPAATIGDIQLHLPPNVYHPGIGLSSRFLVDGIAAQDLGTSVLDLGCGSGYIGISVYRPGMELTLSDISPSALASASENLRRMSVPGKVVASDLFGSLAGQRFDTILFNPPLFDKPVETQAEVALCDPDGELLARFFIEAPKHLKVDGSIYFVASNLMNRDVLQDGLQHYAHEVVEASCCKESQVWRWLVCARPRCRKIHLSLLTGMMDEVALAC